MMIFFTRIFSGRYTLHKNSTQASQKNPIISPKLGNKIIIFTTRQSKPKNKTSFFSCLLWPWIEVILGNLRPQQAWYKMCVLTRKGEGLHRFGIILNMPAKVYFIKLCTGKSLLFEWSGLYEMFSLDED